MHWRKPQLVGPLALAALLRGAHLGFLAARDPLFRDPVVDAWFHANQASLILSKGWLLPGVGAFYKGPLYSYVLAMLFSLFGTGGGVVAARVLSVVCGCLSVLLVARIADRLAGRGAAWCAGIAAAVYGTAVYYDATLLLVPVVITLLLAAAERMVAAAESGDQGAVLARLAVAGALLGLVTITRANGLLAVAAAAAWAAYEARRGRWPGVSLARAAALIAVPALVVIAPVTARNALMERDSVLVSWNGGINLFMGNDPAFDQASGNWHPDLSWMRLYDAPRGIGLTRRADHQRFFVSQTLARAVAAPARQARILAEKAQLFVCPYEIQSNRRIAPAKKRSPVLAVLMAGSGPLALPLGLFGPLIVVGLVLAGRRTVTGALPLCALAAASALTPLLFFNTARFRLPSVMLLLPAAAVGWCVVHELSLPRLRLRLAVATVLVAVLMAAGWSAYPAAPTLPPSDLQHLADVAQRRGDRDEEMELRRQAVASEPLQPMPRIRLGDRLRKAGRFDEAIEQYEAVLATPGLAADWYNAALRSVARNHLGAGRPGDAAAWYGRFLSANPDAPATGSRPDFHLRGMPPLVACEVRLELAEVYAELGERARAAAELGRVMTDCERSESLVSLAQAGLRRMAEAAPAGLEEDR